MLQKEIHYLCSGSQQISYTYAALCFEQTLSPSDDGCFKPNRFDKLFGVKEAPVVQKHPSALASDRAFVTDGEGPIRPT